MSVFISIIFCLNLATLALFPYLIQEVGRFLKCKKILTCQSFCLFVFKPCNTCAIPAGVSLTL